MCTVVLLLRPGHEFPVMLGANRDERIDRAWDAPGEFWPGRPNLVKMGVVAGRDRTGGGTWMGMNRQGVAATVLNRQGTLGPAIGKRSRGELPLIALEQPTALAAVAAIAALDAGGWRGFNMVIADAHGAHFLHGLGRGHAEARVLGAGVHMVTAHEPNDPGSPRVARHLARFQADLPSDPEEWGGWRAILADRSGPEGTEINIPPRGGFGTVSSAFMSWPSAGAARWLFASGPPHVAEFVPIKVG